MRSLLVVVLALWASASSLQAFRFSRVPRAVAATRLGAVPLELTGKLDPSKKWKVKFVYKGEVKEVELCEDTSALEMGETLWDDVESSCRNGVCTTCCGKICSGNENVQLAVHGLGKPQIDAGFVCTCQTYVTGPGVTIELGQNEQVYELQYGQFEESYEMKFSDKKEGVKRNNLFGGK